MTFKFWAYFICISAAWVHLGFGSEEQKTINVQAVLLGSDSGGGAGSGGANSVNYGNPTPASAGNLIIQNQGKLIILLASDLMKQTNCSEGGKADDMRKQTRDVSTPQAAKMDNTKQPVDTALLNLAQTFFYNPSRTEQSLKADATDSPVNPENPVRPDKPARPDKPERPDNADSPEKPGKPDKPDGPDDSKRPDKPDRPDRPDKPKRPGTPSFPQTFLYLPQDQSMPDMPNQPVMPPQPVKPDSSEKSVIPVMPIMPDMPEMPLMAESLHYSKERKRALKSQSTPPDEYDDDNDERDDESDHNDSEEDNDENVDEKVNEIYQKLMLMNSKRNQANSAQSSKPDEYDDDNDEKDDENEHNESEEYNDENGVRKGEKINRKVSLDVDSPGKNEHVKSVRSTPPDEYDENNNERDDVSNQDDIDENFDENYDEQVDKNDLHKILKGPTNQKLKFSESKRSTPPDEYDDDNDERDEPDAHNDSEENHHERHFSSNVDKRNAKANDDEDIIKIFDDHDDEYEDEDENEFAEQKAVPLYQNFILTNDDNETESFQVEVSKEISDFYLEGLLRQMKAANKTAENLNTQNVDKMKESVAQDIEDNTEKNIDEIALVQNLLQLYEKQPEAKQELYELIKNEHSPEEDNYKNADIDVTIDTERQGNKNQGRPAQNQPQKSNSGLNLVNGPTDSPVPYEGNVGEAHIEFIPISEEGRESGKNIDYNIERPGFGGQYFRYDTNDHDNEEKPSHFMPKDYRQSAEYGYDDDRESYDRNTLDRDEYDRDNIDHDDIDHDDIDHDNIDHDNIDHDHIDHDDIDHDNEDSDDIDYDHLDLDYKDYDHLEGDYRDHAYREREWMARERYANEHKLRALGRKNRDQRVNKAREERNLGRDHARRDDFESDRTQSDHERKEHGKKEHEKRDHEKRDHKKRDHEKRNHKKGDSEENSSQNTEDLYSDSDLEAINSADVNANHGMKHVNIGDHTERDAEIRENKKRYHENAKYDSQEKSEPKEKVLEEIHSHENEDFYDDQETQTSDYESTVPQVHIGKQKQGGVVQKIGPEQVYSQETEDLYQDYEPKTSNHYRNDQGDPKQNFTANKGRLQYASQRDLNQTIQEKFATRTKSMQIAKSKGDMSKILNNGNTESTAERESTTNERDRQLANEEQGNSRETRTRRRNEKLRKLREEHERKKAERAAKKEKRNERKS